MYWGGVFLFLSLLYNSYIDISNRYHAQIRYSTNLISNKITSDLQEDEVLLEFIGKEIFKERSGLHIEELTGIVDNLLQYNTNLIGFVLVDTSGKYILSSSNTPKSILNKLTSLKSQISKDSFKKSLLKKEMVLDNTFYCKEIKMWIVPLKKAIRDKEGNVLGVIMTSLILNSNRDLADIYKMKKRYIGLIKDSDLKNDMYMQYYSNVNETEKSIYLKPLNYKSINHGKKIIKEKYSYTLDNLRKNKKIVTYVAKSMDGKQYMLNGLRYNSKYNYWLLLESDIADMKEDIQKVIYRYLVIFFTSLSLFYFLFRKIALRDEKKKKELLYQAEHDMLTLLPNRTYLYKYSDEWIKKHQNSYKVLYIDLDNFKNINDRYGHTVGDKILVEVSKRLKDFFPEETIVVRQGGDEFIVLISDVSNDLLNELLVVVSTEYKVDNKEFRVGLSVGVASSPDDGKELEELLSLADTAMYQAKKRKNTYSFFTESLRQELTDKANIEEKLRGAIENNEMWMVYQPQVNASDGSIYGVESLIRWQNEELGFVGPDKFISIAEETGLIIDIGAFIFKSAFSQINQIKQESGKYFRLSINISVIQFMEENFFQTLLNAIDIYNFDKKSLTLEITESLSIEDLSEIIPLLKKIREEGIEISMDDFGTGYSSLSMLRELPIDELKIDKSFIDFILENEKEKALVQSIITIGKNFNMKILAEGVEDVAQLEELRKDKCDLIQGYYFSKPLKQDQLKDYLSK